MEDGQRIRVALADDHSMVREALARILDDSGVVSVVGQAQDGLEVLRVVEATNPECVVLDYSMPNLDAPSGDRIAAATQCPRQNSCVDRPREYSLCHTSAGKRSPRLPDQISSGRRTG